MFSFVDDFSSKLSLVPTNTTIFYFPAFQRTVINLLVEIDKKLEDLKLSGIVIFLLILIY